MIWIKTQLTTAWRFTYLAPLRPHLVQTLPSGRQQKIIGEFDEEVVKTVRKNFYVDDCLKPVESSAQAINLAAQLRDILSRDGFRLLKWFSNRPEVMETIPESERASSVLDLDLDKRETYC